MSDFLSGSPWPVIFRGPKVTRAFSFSRRSATSLRSFSPWRRGRHWPIATRFCLKFPPKKFQQRLLAGIAILVGLVPVVWFLLQRPGMTEPLVKGICALVALTLIYLTVRHRDRREKRNMTAYLILTIGSLMFWSLYQMAPSGLMLFAVNNVDRMIGKVEIQPQWIQNINTVCIVDWRTVARCVVHQDARARLEDRHSTTVRSFVVVDGDRVPDLAGRHQNGLR